MSEIKNGIELRSDKVQEILTYVPNWVIRWGITLFFLLILMLLVLSVVIRYPETVEGSVLITTEKAPIKLTARGSGILTKLYVDDEAMVKQGQVLAMLENPLNQDAINFLTVLMDTIKNHKDCLASGKYEFPKDMPNFGELQENVGRYQLAVEEYFTWSSNNQSQKRINNLKEQVCYHKQLGHVLKSQQSLAQKDYHNANNKYDVTVSLFDKGVISWVELLEVQSTLNQKEQNVEQLKTSLIQNNITITNIEKQLIELEFEQNEKIRQLTQEIDFLTKLIYNQVEDWQQSYLIRSPYDGRVNFLSNLNEKEFVTVGSPLFAVLPEDNRIIGYVQLPSQGAGKIRKGQRVNIQLSNFPAYEFGQLKGAVYSISEVQSVDQDTKDKFYLVKLELPDGLLSTYQKELDFSAEMIGVASIITQDLSVFDRVFNQFRIIFDK